MLASPWRYTTIPDTEKKTLILLDVSRSMLAEDILPNRIESAKNAIQTLLTGEKNSIGLIIFAGKPFLSIPFSDDFDGITSVLQNISPKSIVQSLPGLSGTAIGDAILLAKMTLSGATERSSIVLITDGRANVGIDPIEATNALPHIPIYTIGIGGEGGGALSYTDPMTHEKTYLYDESGSLLTSDVDTGLLRKIAQISGGTYAKAENALIMREKIAEISTRKSGEKEIKTKQVHQDLTLVFAGASLVMIMIIVLIQKSIYRRGHII